VEVDFEGAEVASLVASKNSSEQFPSFSARLLLIERFRAVQRGRLRLLPRAKRCELSEKSGAKKHAAAERLIGVALIKA